jgi:hypothetical protein
VRAVALGLGAHLLRRLDGDHVRGERLGQQHREAPGAGAEVENRQLSAVAADVAGQRIHP